MNNFTYKTKKEERSWGVTWYCMYWYYSLQRWRRLDGGSRKKEKGNETRKVNLEKKKYFTRYEFCARKRKLSTNFVEGRGRERRRKSTCEKFVVQKKKRKISASRIRERREVYYFGRMSCCLCVCLERIRITTVKRVKGSKCCTAVLVFLWIRYKRVQ